MHPAPSVYTSRHHAVLSTNHQTATQITGEQLLHLAIKTNAALLSAKYNQQHVRDTQLPKFVKLQHSKWSTNQISFSNIILVQVYKAFLPTS